MDRHRIYRELFNRVVQGSYPQGEWLREDTIASEFGVSRTPVREALFQLAQDGLAESLPKRGFRSVGFTVDDLEEAYEIRRVLELLALDRAIQTLPIEALRRVRLRLQEITGSDDPILYAEVDSDLHRVIVDAARSPRLSGLLASLYRIMRTFREIGFSSPDVRMLATKEHFELIAALASRDASLASRILHEHIRASKRRLLEQVLDGKVGQKR